MERFNDLFTVMMGLYDSLNARLDVYVDSLTGAYDKIKRLEKKQRRLEARLALLEEGLNKGAEEKKDGEEKNNEEKRDEES